METCSKHCNDLDINSSPPRSCLDASVGVSTSSDEDHSELRCSESPEETSGDFAALSNLSRLPPNDDSGVETPMDESPKAKDQIMDAICRRTRAHFSLTDMSLDELETFLQESDEEDYFQNVDDEEEYRKFVAAVQGNWKEGSGVDGIDGSRQAEEDDEDEDEEDDYDFEIELEEALESDYEELPKQEILRRKRRQRAAVLGHTLKKRILTERPLGSARTPLRPLLPSIAGRDASSDARKLFNEALHNGNEAIGFTPCQRRQLQCLIHEHVQLLVQVFSVTVLDPARQQIAADTHKLLVQLADAREQVLSWKRPFHPEICCCPYNAHSTSLSNSPLVKLNAFQPRSPNQFISKQVPPKETSCLTRGVADTNVDSDTSNLQKGESNGEACNLSTSTPSMRKVNSLLDIAPLALVKDFVADVAKGVQDCRQQRLQVSDSTDRAQKPLFPVSMIKVQPTQNCQRKKTMAGSLVEDTKLNGIILVPPEISAAISRFTALFDPTLFPYKPPPAALAKRLLFTEAEDELLAMGLMRYNTNWEKIQQLLLPSKTTHQIFIRQKNRSTTRAPENSIKAVRRLKTSPLTKEEEACIEEGLKFFRSDWMKVWEHCIPYRDPATLPRLWRAAVGLQKSYSASEEAKEKHRISEKMRRQKQALLKEQNDGTIGDLNSGDETCEDTSCAYFHEAFLTDYNSQVCSPCAPSDTTACPATAAVQNSLTAIPNIPMPTAPCLPTLKSEYLHSVPSLGNFDTNFKASRRTGKRYRRSSFQIIKLAPGLPSLNLPRCVRVIPQAKYNSEFSAHGKSFLAPGPHGNSRSQKGGFVDSASGSGFSFVPTPVPSPAYCTGPSDSPSFHVPAKMHPLLMQTTFETAPLSSSTLSKQVSPHTVIPKLPTIHNVPRFRPFLSVSKGKSIMGSMEVVAIQTESSTRSVAELHPFLQDDGDRQTQSEAVAKGVIEPKSSALDVPQAGGANTGTSHMGHAHWPFFLSDSVIRPEPRRAVRVQNAHQDCSAPAPIRNKRNRNVANVDIDKRGRKANSKDITGHADILGPSELTEKDSGNFVNSCEEENIVMEQEELSGSEEETEEVVQFEYEEITDSDNDESNGIHLDKGEEVIEFEEEEIGSDDGDSEVGPDTV